MQDAGPGCCLEALQTAVPRLRASGRQERTQKHKFQLSSRVGGRRAERRDAKSEKKEGRRQDDYWILHTESQTHEIWGSLIGPCLYFWPTSCFLQFWVIFFIISAIIPVSNSSKGCIHHMNSWSLLLSFLSFTSKQSGLATLAKQLACLQPVAYVFRFNRPCCGSIWPEPTDMMTKITKTTTAFSSAPTSKSPEYEKNTLSC